MTSQHTGLWPRAVPGPLRAISGLVECVSHCPALDLALKQEADTGPHEVLRIGGARCQASEVRPPEAHPTARRAAVPHRSGASVRQAGLNVVRGCRGTGDLLPAVRSRGSGYRQTGPRLRQARTRPRDRLSARATRSWRCPEAFVVVPRSRRTPRMDKPAGGVV